VQLREPAQAGPRKPAAPSDLANRDYGPTAIVTGAGRGVGRAIAVALARAGFSLCLAARSEQELRATRKATGLDAARSLIVLVDLADSDAPDALFSTALEHFGRVDVLVNNAGWAPARTALTKMSEADLDRVLAVNLRAPIALARLAAAAMTGHGGGTIVNIASAAARNTPAGETVYAAAKAGLIAFTRAGFAELRRGKIRVSVVVPGLVDTSLIPSNKRLDRSAMLRAEDVAEAVMQIVRAPAHACPLEIVLEPQIDPIR
jgi:2-hydroxycyclohexanecarboxyl-CoA dehydrogenase